MTRQLNGLTPTQHTSNRSMMNMLTALLKHPFRHLRQKDYAKRCTLQKDMKEYKHTAKVKHPCIYIQKGNQLPASNTVITALIGDSLSKTVCNILAPHVHEALCEPNATLLNHFKNWCATHNTIMVTVNALKSISNFLKIEDFKSTLALQLNGRKSLAGYANELAEYGNSFRNDLVITTAQQHAVHTLVNEIDDLLKKHGGLDERQYKSLENKLARLRMTLPAPLDSNRVMQTRLVPKDISLTDCFHEPAVVKQYVEQFVSSQVKMPLIMVELYCQIKKINLNVWSYNEKGFPVVQCSHEHMQNVSTWNLIDTPDSYQSLTNADIIDAQDINVDDVYWALAGAAVAHKAMLSEQKDIDEAHKARCAHDTFARKVNGPRPARARFEAIINKITDVLLQYRNVAATNGQDTYLRAVLDLGQQFRVHADALKQKSHRYTQLKMENMAATVFDQYIDFIASVINPMLVNPKDKVNAMALAQAYQSGDTAGFIATLEQGYDLAPARAHFRQAIDHNMCDLYVVDGEFYYFDTNFLNQDRQAEKKVLLARHFEEALEHQDSKLLKLQTMLDKLKSGKITMHDYVAHYSSLHTKRVRKTATQNKRLDTLLTELETEKGKLICQFMQPKRNAICDLIDSMGIYTNDETVIDLWFNIIFHAYLRDPMPKASHKALLEAAIIEGAVRTSGMLVRRFGHLNIEVNDEILNQQDGESQTLLYHLVTTPGFYSDTSPTGLAKTKQLSQAIQYLVAKGASWTIGNFRGVTPMMLIGKCVEAQKENYVNLTLLLNAAVSREATNIAGRIEFDADFQRALQTAIQAHDTLFEQARNYSWFKRVFKGLNEKTLKRELEYASGVKIGLIESALVVDDKHAVHAVLKPKDASVTVKHFRHSREQLIQLCQIRRDNCSTQEVNVINEQKEPVNSADADKTEATLEEIMDRGNRAQIEILIARVAELEQMVNTTGNRGLVTANGNSHAAGNHGIFAMRHQVAPLFDMNMDLDDPDADIDDKIQHRK